jgi:hypothetical protein
MRSFFKVHLTNPQTRARSELLIVHGLNLTVDSVRDRYKKLHPGMWICVEGTLS